MKNVKLYRAATMREALKKIKDEMGEDALVLSHKEVRAGGIFGLGSKKMIEIKVASENGPKKSSADKSAKASRPSSLNMIDDAPAMPSGAQSESEKTDFSPSAFAALAMRAYASAAEKRKEQGSGEREQRSGIGVIPMTGLQPSAVEASPVRRTAAVTSTAKISAAEPKPISTQANPVTNELQRLRSEFRELKYSFAAACRTSMQQNRQTGDHDLELFESPYYEIYTELMNAGLSHNFAARATRAAMQMGDRAGASEEKIARAGAAGIFEESLRFAEDPLMLPLDMPGAPTAIVFIGPTGVGKTTTIAKLAARAVFKMRRRVELITLDTYRIAAVEQLKTYAEIIGVGFHVARSIAELDEMIRSFAGKAVVLVDTAGRSPNDLADQIELAGYLSGSCDILKCLVLQATTHREDAQIAVNKFSLYRPDQIVITKLDETVRPGSILETAAEFGLPLAYICAGQRVPEDLERATPVALAAQIVRSTLLVATA